MVLSMTLKESTSPCSYGYYVVQLIRQGIPLNRVERKCYGGTYVRYGTCFKKSIVLFLITIPAK